MKKISLIISVYNEDAVLDKFYNKFRDIISTVTWEHELLFINDGSIDESYNILKKIARNDKRVKIINFSKNFGHEAAMIAGIDYASGDGIICMDADLQHPLECIPQIIEKLENGYDVINMVRISNKSASVIKRITSGGFYKVINLLADNTHFEKNASDFFGISKNVAIVLKNSYRDKNRFLRGYIQNVGYKKTNLEYIASERAGGKSHYSIKCLLKFSTGTIIGFSDIPLKLGLYAGGFSGILGIILLAYTLLTYKGAPAGYATIVVMMCFFFSMLFIVIGIIGEYIAVLFMELKDRPIYIIKDKLNFEEDK